jgi:hypothetical protein
MGRIANLVHDGAQRRLHRGHVAQQLRGFVAAQWACAGSQVALGHALEVAAQFLQAAVHHQEE